MPQTIELVLYSRDEDLPVPGRRVVCYSPAYAEANDQTMTHRIMDSQFVRISTEVKYWAYVDQIKP